MTTGREWKIVAGLNGFLALVMGAIAAHAITDVHAAGLARQASIYELIHAAVLLWLADRPGKYACISRWLILAGIILFCGAIYLKALLGWNRAVMLAPLGGIGLMLGWIMIALQAMRDRKG